MIFQSWDNEENEMSGQPADVKSLSDRARVLLKTLIETHISDGHPVGSRTLAKFSGLDVSAATIRNVMSDLEDLGLIASPHTSAGRIPTPAGYRVFIDSMLRWKPVTRADFHHYQSQLSTAGDSQALVDSASQLLSGITQMAGVVTLPKQSAARLEQLEFVKLGEKRVLAVLVFAHGEVQNRVLQLARDYRKSELQSAANYLTEKFSGLDLAQARQELVVELKQIRSDMNQLMDSVMELGGQALGAEGDERPDDYILVGQTLLMGYEELSNIEKLRKLFETFSAKQDILHILDRCTEANGIQIFIGQESGSSVLNDCSVVSAPYSVDGHVVGVLGVIGPTRMAYERVIPVVDVTARLLGAALNSR